MFFLLRSKSRAARRRNVRLLIEHLEGRSLLAQVGYQVHLLPPDGSIVGPELTSVSVGQAYDLAISVRDVRSNPGNLPGVFAGYVDVGYDSSKTHVQVGEVQRIRIGPFDAANPASSASGSFTLLANGHTTWPIAFNGDVNALASATELAIGALTGFGLGNVSVKADVISGDNEIVLQVRFLNRLYDQNVANLAIGQQSLAGPTNPQVSLTYEGDLGSGGAFAFREAFRSRLGEPAYVNGLFANNQPNVLDDVGAFASIFPTGTGVKELVRARMVATAAGSVTFTPNLASMTPGHETLLFDPLTPVPVAEIDLGTPKTLTIATAPIVAKPDFHGTLTNYFMPIAIDVLANDITTPAIEQAKSIVAVSPAAHGTTGIHSNRIHYTPNPGFTGTDTFTYTARNITAGAASQTSTGTVTVTVVAPTMPLMRYQVRLVSPGGALFQRDPQNPAWLVSTADLTTLDVGEEYDMVVTVQPTSMTPQGVFSGYTDVTFDESKTRLQAPEIQTVTIGPFPQGSAPSSASGTFRLDFGGLVTEEITYTASLTTLATRVRTALEALPGVGAGHIRVVGNGGGGGLKLKIAFEGKFAGEDVANLTVASSTLTGTSNPSVSVSYEGDLQAGVGTINIEEAFRPKGVSTIAGIADSSVIFSDGRSAAMLPGRIDDVGGFTSMGLLPTTMLTGPEMAAGITVPPPRELARGRFKATAAGTVTFAPDLTAISRPQHEAGLLVGISGPIELGLISTGTPKTLTIVAAAPYQASADNATTLEDSAGVVIEVLGNDTAPAPSTSKQIVSFTQPGNGAVVQIGTTLRYVPAANFSGTDTFTYAAKGNATGAGMEGTATVTVTVAAVNDAPTLDAIGEVPAVLEDAGVQSIVLSGITAGGGESQTLTITAESSNPTLTGPLSVNYSSGTGVQLSYQPVANAYGSATITITVRDGGGTADGGSDSFSRSISVVVNPVNDGPTLDAIDDLPPVLEDADVQIVLLADITTGGESQNLTITAESSNPELTGSLSISYQGPGSEGQLSFEPAANAWGNATVTIIVKDSGGTADGGVDSISRSFTLVVEPVNDAPSFVPGGNQEATDESGPQSVERWATVFSAGPGEDDQTAEFHVVADNAALFSVPPRIDDTGRLTYTPALNAEGTAIVTVELIDNGTNDDGGENSSGPVSFTIRIVKLHPLHNAALPLDATGDSSITAKDALHCINYLNAFGIRKVSEIQAEGESVGEASESFLDVNADGRLTAADPLAIINHLNAFGPLINDGSGGEGEGSSLASADLTTVLAMLAADTAEVGGRKRR